MQITVYDSKQTICGQAEGSLRLSLPPGLYRVHLERGGVVHKQIVDHEEVTELEHAGPPLISPVPIAGAATSHDYYVSPAQKLSVEDTGPPLGNAPHTSRLFLFIRRAERDGLPRSLPSELVSIHDLQGRPLTELSRSNAEINDDHGYLAFSCQVASGTYRIRATRSQRDIAITIPDGRAAHVFVADTQFVRLDELRISLVPAGTRFDPMSPIWTGMESMLAALSMPGRGLPIAARALLPGAIDDDLCFGIVAAHLLWREDDHASTTTILKRLASYREIPDVTVLEGWAHHDQASTVVPDIPPLLRASLVTAMTRPEFDSRDIPADGALAQAARRRFHDSVWCTWSTRAWDERWIEPTVERLRAHGRHRDANSIASDLALPSQTILHTLQALDAATPRSNGQSVGSTEIFVPGYALDTLLGRGERSTVYRATRLADRTEVALKIVPLLGGTNECTRVCNEIDRLPSLEHPRILRSIVHGVLPGDTGIWFEMELCRGSMLDLLSEADAPLPVTEAHPLMLDALAGLAYLHERGMVHGHITPGNLLVRHDGSGAIADLRLTATRAGATRSPEAASTSRFAPPELLIDHAKPQFTSDVWSMAATFYFALTLEPPRDEYVGQSQFVAARDNPIVPAAMRRSSSPAMLMQCIDRALLPERDARPINAASFRDQLASLRIKQTGSPPLLAVSPGSAPSPGAKVASNSSPARLTRKRTGPFPAHLVRGTSRRIQLAIASAIIAATAGLLLWKCADARLSSCEHEIRNGDARRGVKICLDGYRATGNDHDRLWAAKGYLRVGELDKAEQLARLLLTGAFYADAHQILSYVALRNGAADLARMHATVALVAHTMARDDLGRSSDAVLLSQIAWRVGDFTAALQAANDAVSLTQRLGDPHKEVIAHIARADALRQMGDLTGAAVAAESAVTRAESPCDQAWARLKNAMCLMASDQISLAVLELTSAERVNLGCGSSDIPMQIAVNLALLLRTNDPAGALARLDEVERKHGDQAEVQLIRSYIAAAQGSLTDADRHLARAVELGAPDGDWSWEFARARAELLELRGGPLNDVLAEYYYRSAIAMVATLRATARSRAAYLVTSHRDPYDGLIALLARQRRWRDALSVILELDASDMLRATAEASDVTADSGLLPVDAAPVPATTLRRASVAEVLSAWRGRDLVIVFGRSPRHIGPGRERMYRLRIAGGEVTGEDVGDASTARTWAQQLFRDPGDRDAARGLGRMLVPPGDDDSTLHVLAIGSLAKAPLAALRDPDGSLSIARRPLVKILALQAMQPEATGTGPSVIIADPRGDLPSAAAEGFVVAPAVGPGAQLSGFHTGIPATADRLWAAADAASLHVASHVIITPRGHALHLADGDVDSREIVKRHLAPRVAVLAGCGSAAATDEEGWGSIAAALLEAGTAVVIATDRNIDDQVSLSVISAFYAQRDWRTDPARALARVQRGLDARTLASSDDATRPRSWAAFSVLGRPPMAPGPTTR